MNRIDWQASFTVIDATVISTVDYRGFRIAFDAILNRYITDVPVTKGFISYKAARKAIDFSIKMRVTV